MSRQFEAFQIPVAVFAEQTPVRQDNVRPDVALKKPLPPRECGVLFRRTYGRFRQHQITTIGPYDQPVVVRRQTRSGVTENATSPERLACLKIEAVETTPAPVDVSFVDDRDSTDLGGDTILNPIKQFKGSW